MSIEGIELLVPLFFLVAWIYASVGFGGGSSYMALLMLFNVSYLLAPSLSLACNLIVAGGGFWHFYRQGHFRMPLFWPFALSSLPCAYWGGSILLKKEVFVLVLGCCLLLAGLRMLFFPGHKDLKYFNERGSRFPSLLLALPLGAILGFLAGLVGIGGGIFLTPVLHMGRWGTPKQISCSAAAFIFLNSIFALMGHASRTTQALNLWENSWPLFVAVLVGGQVGAYLGSRKIPQLLVEKITAVLILLVSMKLLV